MKLYLVRHTTAADFAPSDAQRPLTFRGEEEARKLGAALAQWGVQPACICASPLVRANQTASLIAGQLQFTGAIETLFELENGAATQDLLKALPVHPDQSILLVGHMPSLADHLAAIIAADDTAALSFSKGSVACVTIQQLQLGTGQLDWLRHLRDLP